jgi:Domain of unknown function (DUF1707)
MTDSVALQPAAGVRCSDADRERTGTRIRDAAGEGFLTMDELDERLAGAYSARYRHELDALVTDLPHVEPAAATGWRAVLQAMWAQLGADAAVLFGRGGAGWTRRRIVLAVIVLLFAVFVVASALHGFGGGGGDIERHGFEGPPFGGPGHHF